ncbi:NADH-quinone oxidoreductase subunit C [Iamia majanohamensis]|uniref:NADH-quinone oxidoreductase n=1 Tax=Iamia majanohamensis TaxID=467976 RepID=A0AAF0BV50_9ACTN|nr:NADH-quinone oxidoreductase subunit C [Iamia majanohamensis]WCO66713.1 NADH-quinone oxidoreductase subunit C [Iamia majanohamensis]
MPSDTETEAAEAETPEPDPVREGLRDRMAAELGDALLASDIAPGTQLTVRVAAEAWRTAGLVARDHLGCRWFDFLSAIDWMPSPYGRYEDDGFEAPAAIDPDGPFETGVAGGETRFQVFARVVDTTAHTDVVLKADVPPDTLTVPSWVPVYDGADWHERETWEMFGVAFDGHPALRNIYLPSDFEGNPLRKDFPLIARIVKPWPGIVDVEPMPEEDEEPAGEEGDAS